VTSGDGHVKFFAPICFPWRTAFENIMQAPLKAEHIKLKGKYALKGLGVFLV